MAINVLEMLKSQVGSQIAGQLGSKFSVDEQIAKSGIDALLPTILGGLVNKVSAPGGAEKLDETLREGGFDGGLLDNLGGLFSGDGGDPLANQGGGLVSMIFGDKAAVLGPIIAKLTGMKSDSIMSMLAMLAPLVMSFLGKQKSTAGMDANGLASLLMSQKDSIAAAMPPGVSNAMGLGLMSPAAPAAAIVATPPRVPSTPTPVAGNRFSPALVLISLVILGGVGYGCYNYIFDGIRPSGAAGNIVIEIDPNSANDGGYGEEVASSAPPSSVASAVAPEKSAVAPEKAAGTADVSPADEATQAIKGFDDGELVKLLESLTGVFEKTTDVESAKVALPALELLDKKLGNVTSKISTMPVATRDTVLATIRGAAPDLEMMFQRVRSIAGVEEILEPVIVKLIDKIRPITTQR